MLLPAVRTFYEQQLAWKQQALAALQAAHLALTTGGVQSYTLNTGQTVQTVTRMNLPSLLEQIAMLERQVLDLMTKLGETDGRVVIAKPGF